MPHSGTVLKIFQKILFEEMFKTCHASSFVAFPLLTAPQRSSASVATRNHKGLHLASMEVATQVEQF
jgi:hypothetical protein